MKRAIHVREMSADELDLVPELDVSDSVDSIYVQDGTALRLMLEGEWIPSRTAAEWRAELDEWKEFVGSEGTAFGAFEASHLVGFAVLRAHLTVDTSQLAGLYVDRAHRRRGIGRSLVTIAAYRARRIGSSRLYVSATRSRSTVRAYLSCGFLPMEEPHQDLLAKEPLDIHMSLELQSRDRGGNGI